MSKTRWVLPNLKGEIYLKAYPWQHKQIICIFYKITKQKMQLFSFIRLIQKIVP